VEINAEKSDELLNNYVFFTLKYDHPAACLPIIESPVIE